ncbi:Transmembrane protein 97 [Actinomortierella ambigua]|nr:Transmembrane protein 97 [Actinomortierella ambigua]
MPSVTIEPPAHVSLWKRPKDLAMFIFFVTLVPITLCIDMVPMYPTALDPYTQPIQKAFAFYLSVSKDPLMGALLDTVWFKAVIILKAVIQPPLALYASVSLYRNQTRQLALPVVAYSSLLVTVMIPMLSTILFERADRIPFPMTDDERVRLACMYSPWILFPFWMLVENYRRVQREIQVALTVKTK